MPTEFCRFLNVSDALDSHARGPGFQPNQDQYKSLIVEAWKCEGKPKRGSMETKGGSELV